MPPQPQPMVQAPITSSNRSSSAQGSAGSPSISSEMNKDMAAKAWGLDSPVTVKEEDPWEAALRNVETPSPQSPQFGHSPPKTIEDPLVQSSERLSFRGLVKMSEQLRDRAIRGEMKKLDSVFSSATLIEFLENAVFERLSDEREERMLKHCIASRDVLQEAWREYRKNIDRTMSGDLNTGRQVALVLNTARIPDLDIGKMSSLTVLRSVESKRKAVLRDLARRFRSSCHADFINYLMAKNFVDDWTWKLGNNDAMVAQGALQEEDVRQVFKGVVVVRLEGSLGELLESVSKRHGLCLSFFKPYFGEFFAEISSAVADELLGG